MGICVELLRNTRRPGPKDYKSEPKSNEKENKESSTDESFSFYKLFSLADSTDHLLMTVGAIAAVGNGIPIMSVLFGQVIDSFGTNQNNGHMLRLVSMVCLRFVYLAVGAGVVSFLQVACWTVTGERQASKIRALYLKTILRQDVAFFDIETTRKVVGRMSGDTVLIQDAMGEKVGRYIQMLTTFIGAFVIAFIKGWLLTLVMLSTILQCV